MREVATLTRRSAVLSEHSQETQMGIGHEASEARLLTKQGRQRGHQRLSHHTNLQMVTEGPISCCPITKRSRLLSTTSSALVLPPCSTSIPPSSEEGKQKVLGLHHCLHHCDNLHIYLVIVSLFCLLLQSISPCLVCAAETCKEVQVVILNDSIFFFLRWHNSLVWESTGRMARGELHQIRSYLLSPECNDLCGDIDL